MSDRAWRLGLPLVTLALVLCCADASLLSAGVGPRPHYGIFAWAPGREIAFESRGGTFAVQPGSAPRRLTALNLESLAWAPGGRKILVTTTQGTSVLDARNGRRLLHVSDGFSGYGWSPSGGRIAFFEFGALYLVNADGSGRRRLAEVRTGESGIAWSPNEKRVAYVRCTAPAGSQPCEHQYGLDLYSRSVGGGGERRLTRKSGFPQCPAWGHVGIAIYVNGRIEVLLRDGRSRIFTGSGCAVWAPDGHRLALWGPGGVNVVDFKRNTRRSYAIRSAQSRTQLPLVWAPDGKAIAAFGPDRSGEANIFVVDLADGRVTTIW